MISFSSFKFCNLKKIVKFKEVMNLVIEKKI